MHEPVLTDEVLNALAPGRGGLFVDCTVGAGGHAMALLDAGADRLVGLDRDPRALAEAEARLRPRADRVQLLHADYRNVGAVLDELGIGVVDGVLADLGVSSMQLEGERRGFSFQRDEPLDMRMDQTAGPTASELLATATEREIADAVYAYGEERHARRIARAIVRAREDDAIATTGQLASIVRRAVAARGWQRIDPATRTFQAIRIWLNGELDGLDRFLDVACRRLAGGGRLAVITFHSLEDRIVKHTLRSIAGAGEVGIRVLTKKPVRPGDAELERNPRARSAKLRAAERADAR